MSPRRLLVLLVASFVQPSTSAPAPNGGEGGPGYVTGSVQHLIGRGGTAMIPTMELGFGNPPQKVKVLLDTGSSDLVVPQTGSDICNDPQQQCSENRGGLVTGSFDAKGSDGVTRLNSRVTATYVNGVALQGNFVKAPLTLQSQTVQAMQIALVTQGKLPPGEPLFPVFGIGPIQGEAGQPYPNIPAGMKATGATKSNAFGLYLNDFRKCACRIPVQLQIYTYGNNHSLTYMPRRLRWLDCLWRRRHGKVHRPAQSRAAETQQRRPTALIRGGLQLSSTTARRGRATAIPKRHTSAVITIPMAKLNTTIRRVRPSSNPSPARHQPRPPRRPRRSPHRFWRPFARPPPAGIADAGQSPGHVV